jgi:hypothetical protein
MKLLMWLGLLLLSTALWAEFDHYGEINAVEGNMIIVNDLPYTLTASTRVVGINGGELTVAALAVGQLVGVLHEARNREALEFDAKTIRLLPKDYRFKGGDFWSQPDNPLAR